MPTYVYQCLKCKNMIEEFMSMSDYISEIPCKCGGTANRCFTPDSIAISAVWGKPLISEGAAVHPDQVAEASKIARELGTDVEFQKNGNAVFPTRQGRKKYLRAYGIHDRDGGCGDPTPD